MKQHLNTSLAILIAIVLAATFVVAQQASTSSPSQPMMQMPMMQMMSGQQMGSMHARIADLEKVVTEAQQSNDPAQMKAALNEVQTQLGQWRAHMQSCPMAGGQGMQSGMQGMMQQSGDHAAHHNNPPKQ